ncbi:MAG: hypothetical protein QNJ58_27860, partial [Desulfobacterales bacterium]|nr:hypothetical protein [Desulfobacterales bacterium]
MSSGLNEFQGGTAFTVKPLSSRRHAVAKLPFSEDWSAPLIGSAKPIFSLTFKILYNVFMFQKVAVVFSHI